MVNSPNKTETHLVPVGRGKVGGGGFVESGEPGGRCGGLHKKYQMMGRGVRGEAGGEKKCGLVPNLLCWGEFD